MDLDDSVFDGYPIDFRRINPEHFPSFEIENGGEKQIIFPDENNYIDSFLQRSVNLQRKNTVVINSSVGQGKTYAIIQIVKRYFELSDEYVVFVASPFVSLVDQYERKIVEAGISSDSIYRYERIGNQNFRNYTEKRIHVVTANLLLGNPGENAFINSQAKRDYLNEMSRYCEQKNKKVVFIYDELHDSTYNFKEEFIFNLWKWRNSIHKNFVLSASFSEASKVVIKHLALLTEKKISILESERIQYENPSKLHLHFDNAVHYNAENGTIEGVIRDFIERGLDFDILTYSKALASSLYSNESQSGKMIRERYGAERQLCVSDMKENQRLYTEDLRNRYNPEKCNIGTNFKSGVSIEKENHAYLIVLPPNGARDVFKNYYGIFVDGQNSIIQAIARQRIAGEIHIVLPPPVKMDYDSLNFENQEQADYYRSLYDGLVLDHTQDDESPKYYSFDSHSEVLSDFYENTLRQNLTNEIAYVEQNLDGEVSLNFPPLDSFILEKGDRYLSRAIPFIGDNPSMFVVHSAITNQFVNCKLHSINTKPTQYFNEGRIQTQFENLVREHLTEKLFKAILIQSNDTMTYKLFRENLFEDYRIFYVDNNGATFKIHPFKNKNFETQLLAYIQRLQHVSNSEFNSRFLNQNGTPRDAQYSRGDYFLANISHSRNQNLSEIENEDIKGKVKAYQIMDSLREKLINSTETHTIQSTSETIQYLRKKIPDNFFTPQDESSIEEMKRLLFKHDDMLKHEVFSYKKSLSKGNSYSQLNYLYRSMIKDFVNTENKRVFSNGSEQNVNKINSIKPIPNPEITIDLLSEPNFLNARRYDEMISETEMFNILRSMEGDN